MTHKLLIFVSGTVLALGACGRKGNEGTVAGNGADANIAIANDLAVSPLSAQGFANAAAASDRFEVESSQLAAASASSAAVKRFANQMISAHTASTAKLKTALAGISPAVTADDTLSADQQSALAALRGQKGAGFDSAYAQAQVDAHQKTLDALKNYAATGDNAQLKSFASGMIPTVTAHLNTAKGLQ